MVELRRLQSAEPSKGFGEKGDRQLRNLVMKCTFAPANSSKYRVVGDGTLYTANIQMSEDDYSKLKDEKTNVIVEWFMNDFQEMLNKGEIQMWGFDFPVREISEEKWDSVYNKNTGHTIPAFHPALMHNDPEKARAFVVNGLRRGIEQKRFFKSKEEANA